MQTNNKQKHTKQLQQWGSTSLLSHHLRATCVPDAKRCVEQKGEKLIRQSDAETVHTEK
jgi:hypothetical protein